VSDTVRYALTSTPSIQLLYPINLFPFAQRATLVRVTSRFDRAARNAGKASHLMATPTTKTQLPVRGVRKRRTRTKSTAIAGSGENLKKTV